LCGGKNPAGAPKRRSWIRKAALFLLDEYIGLDVRFELAAAILVPNNDRAKDRADDALH
jgi:hypothetical protein